MPSPPPPVLLTRPRAQADQFADACKARLGPDVRVVVAPLLEIRVRSFTGTLPEGTAIVATSANAVEALGRQVDLHGRTAYCVGAATAATARAAGMRALSAAGDVDDLVELILGQAPDAPLFYPRGAEVRGDVEGELTRRGFHVSSQVLYDQVPAKLSAEARALARDSADIVLPLFSPRSATLAGNALAGAAARLHVVALSGPVAAAWNGPDPASMTIAARPDSDAMLDGIAGHYDSASP